MCNIHGSRTFHLKPILRTFVGRDHTICDEKLSPLRFSFHTGWCLKLTAAYLTLSRELRTLSEMQIDLRQIINEDNIVPLITSYHRKIVDTLDEAKKYLQKEQDRQK